MARVTHNPILKGLRVRNAKMSRRINKTGRPCSVLAPPEERLERYCPHLAFFSPEYYDRIIRKLDLRNAKYRRKGVNGIDHRQHVSKKRTVWPGQHLRCEVCGRLYYWSGLKDRNWMVCSGGQSYQCWNSLALNGTVAVQKLPAAILGEIQALPDHDPTFLEMIKQKAQELRDQQNERRHELGRQRVVLGEQIGRITQARAELGGNRPLLDKLRELAASRDEVEEQWSQCQPADEPALILPSISEIKERATRIFTSLVGSDPETGQILRRLIPDFIAFPFRLCGGGPVVIRARFILQLTSLWSAGPGGLDRMDYGSGR